MLKMAQLNHQQLAERYRSLRIEYATLAAESRFKKSNGSRAPRGTLTGESKEISLAGGRFAVTCELWVSRSLLDMARPEDVDPLDPSRYDDLISKNRAIVEELYQDLPPHLQDALANADRRTSFKQIVYFHVLVCVASSRD